jgi:hypothetical protein
MPDEINRKLCAEIRFKQLKYHFETAQHLLRLMCSQNHMYEFSERTRVKATF